MDLSEEIWRLPMVLQKTGLSRSTIDRMERAGNFPMHFKIGTSAIGWLASEVVAWILQRPRKPPLRDNAGESDTGRV
jgi:prophage regulatory protein